MKTIQFQNEMTGYRWRAERADQIKLAIVYTTLWALYLFVG